MAAGQFTSLEAPFTQSLYGVQPVGNLFGGVTFTGSADPEVDSCSDSGGALYRFDHATTLPLTHGTNTLHSDSELASNTGCGLAADPNGYLYTNTTAGIVELDPNTGDVVAGPFGPAGDALGIAVDPISGNLVYVEANGSLGYVDPGFTTSGAFSTATAGDGFVDQIAFDPSGQYLFASNDGENAVVVIRRDGTLVQSIPLTVGSNPDGIAFHSESPQFVITNDNDGTITRFDFPNNDFTKTPVQSQFAGGGFRGDHAQVGPEGCLYATQHGTRYDDGTIDYSTDSLVQICPGFAPPLGVSVLAAIGDSYIAGEGSWSHDASALPVDYFGGEEGGSAYPQSFTTSGFNSDSASASDRCHRSPASFASLLGVQEPNFVACSGATIAEVVNGSQVNGEASQLSILGPQDSAVLISAGGDDVGFSGVLGACVDGPFGQHQSTDKNCKKAIDSAVASIPTMQQHLTQLVDDVATAAPDAQVVQVGYPRLFPLQGTGSTCSGINSTRQGYLNDAAKKLDEAIASTDSALGVTFVDTRSVFAQHELCSGMPYINDLQLNKHFLFAGPNNCPDDYTVRGLSEVCSQSFHPNTLGYIAEAEYIEARLPAVTSAAATASARTIRADGLRALRSR